MELIDSKYARSYRHEMEQSFSASEAETLWANAEVIFQRLLEENPNQSEVQARHTHVSIFPAIAVYKAVSETDPDKAMTILERGAAAISQKVGAQYAAMVRLPGCKGLFLRLFSHATKSGFGPEAGFAQEFLVDTGKCLAFNMTKCPYHDYCEQYGCGEIVRVFCKNDEYAYGNLPGIQFDRTQTLGTGGTCCDFKLTRLCEGKVR